MRARFRHIGSRQSAALGQRHSGSFSSLPRNNLNPPLSIQEPTIPFRVAFSEATRSFSVDNNYNNRNANNEWSTTKDNDEPRKIPYRPWLDNRLSPEQRVNKFVQVEVGELGWQAVVYDAIPLADRCCQFNDFVGMKLAHDVLDRCLAEKRYFDNLAHNHQQEGGEGSRPFPVPDILFQKILYGWACLATKGEIARRNMRELMDLLIRVSQEEKRIFLNVFDAADKDNNNDNNNNSSSITFRLQPTTNTYNTYLTGIRNACNVSGEAAQTAREVLNEMTYVNRKYGWHTKPNTKSYTLVLHSFRNSGYKDCGIQAERVLQRMKKAHKQEKEKYLEDYGVEYDTNEPHTNQRRIVTADSIAYGHVIQAYAKDPSERSASKAKDLLMEVINLKDGTAKPDLALLTGTLAAFASLAENPRISKEVRSNAAQEAEDMLKSLLPEVLEEASDNNSNNNKKITNREDLHLVAPYNACMNAWAKCDASDAALKAESILQRLLSDFLEGRSAVNPDKISFNTVLNGWARRRVHDSPKKAEDLLKLQMELIESGSLPETAKPDVQSFSIVMLAYSKSKSHDKVMQTYRLLHELIEGLAENKVTPDDRNLVVAFTAVLDAAAYPRKKRAPKVRLSDNTKSASESIAEAPNERSTIDEVGDEVPTHDDLASAETLTPSASGSTETTTDAPCTTENATSANGSEEIPDASNSIGHRSSIDDPWTSDETTAVSMNISNTSSDSATFDAIPDITEGSDDYNIALQVYRELKDDVFRIGCRPDHMAFAKMLLVVGAHTEATSTERRQMLQLIFEDACQAGQVSKLVVKSVFKLKPEGYLLASLFQNNDFLHGHVPIESVDVFPRMWTRNVPQKFRYLTRVNSHNNHIEH